MVIRPDVKEKIQKLRFEDNLSIRTIAKRLRLSPTTVAKYCAHGENQENIVSPNSRSERNAENKRLDDDCLDEYEMLDRIISEITSNFRRPAIVRMVAPYLSNPRKSLSVLAEALTLAEIKPGDKKLILRNWALHVGIKEDISGYFTGKEKETRRVPEKPDPLLEQLDREGDKMLQEYAALSPVVEKPPEKPVEEKKLYYFDGEMLYLTHAESLIFEQYEQEQKKIKKEREKRREEEERKKEEERRRKELAAEEERRKKELVADEERRKKDEEWREDARRRGWNV